MAWMVVRFGGAWLCVATLGASACDPSPHSAPDGNQIDSSNAPTETCNGVDDDLDGVIDEDCPCTPFDVSVPVSTLRARMVWVGDAYWIVTDDEGTWSIAPVRDGVAGTAFSAGPTDPNNGIIYDLAWNGSLLALIATYVNPRREEIAFFDENGAALQRVPSETSGARLAWMGDRFVVVSFAGNGIRLAEYSKTGASLGPAVDLGSDTFTRIHVLANSPTKYVIAVDNYQDPSVFVVDRATKATNHHALSIGPSPAPISVAYASSHDVFGATHDQVGVEQFQSLGSDGTPQGVTMPSWSQPAKSIVLVPEPDGFFAFAMLGSGQPNYTIAAMRIDVNGNPLGAEAPLASVMNPESLLVATRAAGRYAVGVIYGLGPFMFRLIQVCD